MVGREAPENFFLFWGLQLAMCMKHSEVAERPKIFLRKFLRKPVGYICLCASFLQETPPFKDSRFPRSKTLTQWVSLPPCAQLYPICCKTRSRCTKGWIFGLFQKRCGGTLLLIYYKLDYDFYRALEHQNVNIVHQEYLPENHGYTSMQFYLKELNLQIHPLIQELDLQLH